ncbi:MAG: SPOR domain-containing protein [Rubrivivax sp.]
MAQRNGFFIGLVVGLLVGLALALGVALYITKAPMPFVNKVPQRTAEQDSAETERNRNWDPNAPLGGRNGARGAGVVAPGTAPGTAPGAATAAVAPALGAASAPAGSFGPPAVPPLLPPPASERPTARNPGRILAAGADPFVYFVQAGAYGRSVDAEQQRARLALAGQTARITEREQSGRTVYRVRLGPFPGRDEADGLQGRLQDQGIDAQIVRVEK